MPPSENMLFDSFKGLPEPTLTDGEKAISYAGGKSKGKLKSVNNCLAEPSDVKEIFAKLDLNWGNIVICKGWFQKTLPKVKNKIGPIALLRLDGDWYQSTKVCLNNLYNKVISGGYIVIDDYNHWQGCKKAVNEFLTKHKIKIKLKTIDEEGVFFRKQHKNAF